MIVLSPKAIAEVKRLQSELAGSVALRVSVVGGGCSGMSYKLEFIADAAPTDKTFEHDGVKLVTDARSLLFLNGATIDFSDGLNGVGFTFDNPNAKRSCGCGNSFS